MAFAARGDRMDPDERKSCQIMIEPYLFSPAAVIMAAAAFIALLAFVHVIGLVTTAAFRVDLHIFRFITVTIAALDLSVPSRKLEFCVTVMIERAGLPIPAVVTLIAASAVLSLMHIIDGMTVDALGRGLYFEIQLLMTSRAGHLRMFIF